MKKPYIPGVYPWFVVMVAAALAHGVAASGVAALAAVVVTVSVAARPRACRCPGPPARLLAAVSRPGRARGGGPGRTGPAAATQVRPGQAVPGDGRVRGRGDGTERVTQRRPGRLRQYRIGAADEAELEHRVLAHLLGP